MQITEGLITKDSDKTKQGFAKVGKTLLGPELYEERQEKENEINTQYIKKQEEIDKTKNGASWLFNSAKNLGNKELKTLGMNYNIGNARINGAKSIKENEEINTLRSRLVDYTFKGGRTTRIELDSLPVDIQEAVLRLGIDKFLEYIKPTASIQDGIIRPNGQVTQVAPDDWVFAVRDVNKLASAFTQPDKPAAPSCIPYAVSNMLAPKPVASTVTASIQDYIICPNGQVTQVAPDDWVFAVRDVNRLASAFSHPDKTAAASNQIPETVTTLFISQREEPKLSRRSWEAEWQEIEQLAQDALPSLMVNNSSSLNVPQNISVTVNQTITSTSNDWLPQTIREQTASGVQDGIAQAMKDGYRRLQMMSGTL